MFSKNSAKLDGSDSLATSAENGRADLISFHSDRGVKIDEPTTREVGTR